MIKFTHKSGSIGSEIGWTYQVTPEHLLAEQFGYFGNKMEAVLDIDTYLDFRNLLQLSTLKPKYYKMILDGWSWALYEDDQLISSGSNTMPKEIRSAFEFISKKLNGSFIPSLPPENNRKVTFLTDIDDIPGLKKE